MVEREDGLKEANKLIVENQEVSIDKRERTLELLATERVEDEEREREKIIEELNRIFCDVEEGLWEDPSFVKTMEKLKD